MRYCVSEIWAVAFLGVLAIGALGVWAIVSLGDWAIVSLGVWAIVTLGVWAIVTLGANLKQKVKRDETKRFDINKTENFLKNSSVEAQTSRSYCNAAMEHSRAIREIHDDNKRIAELLLRRADAFNGREKLTKAVKNARKLNYESQISELFSTMNKTTWNRLVIVEHLALVALKG